MVGVILLHVGVARNRKFNLVTFVIRRVVAVRHTGGESAEVGERDRHELDHPRRDEQDVGVAGFPHL